MKILMVNKFLYPKGGAETYVFKLGGILQSHGHAVQYFGLKNEKNIVFNASDSYVTDMDLNTGIRGNLKAPFRIIYSSEARRKIRKVLEDFEPDVVHLNNIQFHLTPSIIVEIQRIRKKTGRQIKIVYTAHDYQLVCPSHGLFDPQIQVCEKCLGGNYTHCLRKKCIKNSRMKSLLGMADAYFWKWNKAYTYIDTIICCSRFLKEKLDSQKRFAGKTVALHNFVDEVAQEPTEKEGYVLEFGHLSADKGTLTLLKAARRMPDTKFVFAGFGAAVEQIEKLPNAEYVGFQTGEQLQQLIRKAACSVYPSQWYENCPFSVIESQMYATPVIGSRIGGIPELIEEGRTGELFTPGDDKELEEKLRKILETPGLAEQYSKNCADLRIQTPQTYYDLLMKVYGGNHEDI